MSFIRMMSEKQADAGNTQQSSEAANGHSHSIFAATDATFIECDGTAFSCDHVVRHGKCYRRLTPEYWAWFHHKYHLMENALTRKKISESAFEGILDRIAKLYNHAVAGFGKEMLDAAVRTTDVRKHDDLIKRDNAAASGNQGHADMRRPAAPSLVVERGAQTARTPASAQANEPAWNQATAKVDAVRDRATALGWTHDQLYRTDGIAYRDWGLVRFLDTDDEIGEITAQRIEIVNRKTGKPLYFYNHRVDQPWIRKSSEAGVNDES